MTAEYLAAAAQRRADAEAHERAREAACLWCADLDTEPLYPERELCRDHLAEHEGLSLDGLDRMEAEEAADRL